MKASELIELFRVEADDLKLPYLWEDDYLLPLINQAQIEAARRARILRDITTREVCTLKITTGRRTVALHPSVIRITHAMTRYPNADDPTDLGQWSTLDPVTKRDYDREGTSWRNDSGDPSFYILDAQTGAVTFNRTPTRNGALQIEVERTPLCKISAVNDVLEIPDRYVPDLVYWMLYKAYSKKDADTEDVKEAESNRVKFVDVFGTTSSAVIEQSLQNISPHRANTRFY